jgi:hypothetical protein
MTYQPLRFKPGHYVPGICSLGTVPISISTCEIVGRKTRKCRGGGVGQNWHHLSPVAVDSSARTDLRPELKSPPPSPTNTQSSLSLSLCPEKSTAITNPRLKHWQPTSQIFQGEETFPQWQFSSSELVIISGQEVMFTDFMYKKFAFCLVQTLATWRIMYSVLMMIVKQKFI